MQPTFERDAFRLLAAAEPGHFWFEERRRLILWLLRRHFPNASSYCDVGCGTGFNLAGFARQYPQLRLVGVDPFPEALAFARQTVPEAELTLGDILMVDRPAAFDVIGCFDVLEHIADDHAALAALAARLRPGGGLLLTVPQHPSLWSVADEMGYHRRRYRRRELLTKLRQAGFEPLRVTSFVSTLLPLLWLSRRRASKAADALAEISSIPAPVNAALRAMLRLERGLIRIGVSLPAGGSLVVAARKPAGIG